MTIDEAWNKAIKALPEGGGVTQDIWYVNEVSGRDKRWAAYAVRTCIPVWNNGKRTDWNRVVGIGNSPVQALQQLEINLKKWEPFEDY